MANVAVDPDRILKSLAHRIGELEADNITLRTLLQQAGEELDELRERNAQLVLEIGNANAAQVPTGPQL